MMFEDEEFERACKELDEPDVAEYEFFTESHGVKIYRLYNKESGLYTYKVYGGLSDVAPETCAKVYTDIEYRRKWDGYVKELRALSEEDKTKLYWQVNFPFPMSNRDYVFGREERELDINGRHVWAILARSIKLDSVPERSGVVRVADYDQTMAITSDGSGGTKAFMWYYDNPGGSIPTWLINYAAKTGVPSFLTSMQKACHSYDKYLAEKESGN